MLTLYTSINFGANARNWPGLILMKKGLANQAAVWAQEFYEAKRKTFSGVIRYIFQKRFRRELELYGHEVETQVAVWLYAEDEASYRKKEAESMQKGYSFFSDYSIEAIETAMKAVSEEAKTFVSKHQSRIKRHML